MNSNCQNKHLHSDSRCIVSLTWCQLKPYKSLNSLTFVFFFGSIVWIPLQLFSSWNIDNVAGVTCLDQFKEPSDWSNGFDNWVISTMNMLYLYVYSLTKQILYFVAFLKYHYQTVTSLFYCLYFEVHLAALHSKDQLWMWIVISFLHFVYSGYPLTYL